MPDLSAAVPLAAATQGTYACQTPVQEAHSRQFGRGGSSDISVRPVLQNVHDAQRTQVPQAGAQRTVLVPV